MTYGLIADNIDSSSIGMSMLTVVSHAGGNQSLTFSRNGYSSALSWLVVQQSDVLATEVVTFPDVSYTMDATNFYVSLSGGGTPCNVFLFVR